MAVGKVSEQRGHVGDGFDISPVHASFGASPREYSRGYPNALGVIEQFVFSESGYVDAKQEGPYYGGYLGNFFYQIVFEHFWYTLVPRGGEYLLPDFWALYNGVG